MGGRSVRLGTDRRDDGRRRVLGASEQPDTRSISTTCSSWTRTRDGLSAGKGRFSTPETAGERMGIAAIGCERRVRRGLLRRREEGLGCRADRTDSGTRAHDIGRGRALGDAIGGAAERELWRACSSWMARRDGSAAGNGERTRYRENPSYLPVVFATTNGGATWEKKTIGLDGSGGIDRGHVLRRCENGVGRREPKISGTSDPVVLATVDGGETWTPSGGGHRVESPL